MKLPDGERAIVDIRKLLDYCLNPQHPRGRNKARVFAAIGLHESDAEELRAAILSAARDAEAELGAASVYGQRYVVDFYLFRNGRAVRIRSTWIVATRGWVATAYKLLCIMNRLIGMADIEMHSVVALLEDLPEQGLVRGQVGTVVESWAPGVYEVEFADESGKAFAMAALRAEQVIRLHYEPADRAA